MHKISKQIPSTKETPMKAKEDKKGDTGITGRDHANQMNLSKDEPIASRLKEKDGVSLLLLTVDPFDDSGQRKVIVCVDNKQAEVILAKRKLTVLDYERNDIVRGFGKDEVVSEKAIMSAKTHFENYFVSNAKMKIGRRF